MGVGPAKAVKPASLPKKSEFIDGKTINPIFEGYRFTIGAKNMMADYLTSKAVKKTCFLGICWGYKPSQKAKAEMLRLLWSLKANCGRSENPRRRKKVISTDAVALTINTLRRVSGNVLFSANDAKDALKYLKEGLANKSDFYSDADGSHYNNELVNRCYQLSSYGPGCIYKSGMSSETSAICYSDSGKGLLLKIRPAE